MSSVGRLAPIAAWVTIPDLVDDPFAIFTRLRDEGGVHWVPAVGRYLITSYAAVHDTELDQGTFSANEHGSLMIRAMGHSMLRKDDPEHHGERRAWQPVLRPGVVKRTWMPVFVRTFEETFARFADIGPGADLVWDLAAPYAAESLRRVLGLHNVRQEDLQIWSQALIDATGNYANDPEVWAAGTRSFDAVDVALDEMLSWYATHEDETLLSALVHAPEGQLSLASIRANIKMTIGGGINEPRDAIGVAAWAMMTHPKQRTMVERDPGLWDAAFDEAIRWVSPIGMYSRQTTRDVVLQGVQLPKGAKVGINLLSANRDEKIWPDAHRFDLTRADQGLHLAFGKGVHVCLGAWVARAEVAAVAMPRLFSRLPDLGPLPERPPVAAGWVFRGMTSFPVTWNPCRSITRAAPLSIAIVGSGPSGCYTAQALRRAMPDAEIDVLERLPVPYGLVRYGVAADHQGTKAVSAQFARLFEQDAVRFAGNVLVGGDVSLTRLCAAYNAVVLANGLHKDAVLTVPGADLAGVYGAGTVTRLLAAHPLEPRPAPSLGTDVAIVGMGNVAMDLARLLAKRGDALHGSDINDEAHVQLAGQVHTIHVIGRRQPEGSRFDPVMLREIADLEGVDHVVHGMQCPADDTRSRLVAELGQRAPTGAPIRIEWWFGYSPERIIGEHCVESIAVASEGATQILNVDAVLTAIGFDSGPGQQLAEVSAETAATGRIRRGLYVAGWARRGPRGTIPTQRVDAKALAQVVVADLRGTSSKPGRSAIEDVLASATNYDGWLLIDEFETNHAPAGRTRSKVVDVDEMRRIANTGSGLAPVVAVHGKQRQRAVGDRVPLTVLFATESGNAELVAEELAAHLNDRHEVNIVDLAQANVNDIRAIGLALVVCSTYGDGELPTGARNVHSKLLEEAPDLTGLRYGMLGLGDHSYTTTYSRGSEILDGTFSSLGATRIGTYGRHDAAVDGAAPELATAWAENLLDELAAASSPANTGADMTIGNS